MNNIIGAEELRKRLSVKELKRLKLAKLLKIIFASVFIGIAVLLLIFSIISFNLWSSYSGDYSYKEIYGGDAYTGMQNAMANAANNIIELGHLINVIGHDLEVTMGFLLLSMSIILFAGAAYWLIKSIFTPVVVKQSRIDDLVATALLKGTVRPAFDADKTNSLTAMDELRRYKELFDAGLISAEDFESKKKQLLRL